MNTLKSRIAPSVHAVAYASGLSCLLTRRRRGMRVVMYHGVSSAEAGAFAAQIEYLAARFAIVPLRKVLERVGRSASSDELALTFDDGLRNNATVVYPILRRLGVPATFFVCPGLVESGRWLWNHEARERLRHLPACRRADLCRAFAAPSVDVDAVVEWLKTLPVQTRVVAETAIRAATPDFVPTPVQRDKFDLMGWDDLVALDQDLIEIGSHTVSHAILTRLERTDAAVEIGQSRRLLERRLGRPIEYFAYPNGAYDAGALAWVRKCYRGAVSTMPALIAPGADPHCLPRIPSAGRLPLLAWRMHRPSA